MTKRGLYGGPDILKGFEGSSDLSSRLIRGLGFSARIFPETLGAEVCECRPVPRFSSISATPAAASVFWGESGVQV